MSDNPVTAALWGIKLDPPDAGEIGDAVVAELKRMGYEVVRNDQLNRCQVRSSITDIQCSLAPDHEQWKPDRFHRFVQEGVHIGLRAPSLVEVVQSPNGMVRALYIDGVETKAATVISFSAPAKDLPRVTIEFFANLLFIEDDKPKSDFRLGDPLIPPQP